MTNIKLIKEVLMLSAGLAAKIFYLGVIGMRLLISGKHLGISRKAVQTQIAV